MDWRDADRLAEPVVLAPGVQEPRLAAEHELAQAERLEEGAEGLGQNAVPHAPSAVGERPQMYDVTATVV